MSFVVQGGVFRRAIDTIAASWHEFVHRDDLSAVHADLPARDQERVRSAMLACMGDGGEARTLSSTAALGGAYAVLSTRGKARFLELLASFDVDRERVARAIDAVRESNGEGYGDAVRALRDTTRPPWLAILRQFNRLPSGTKFLVDVREDLLDVPEPSAALARMERDLRDLLASWFDLGFLELRRITWDAPAALLERIAMYEAVHEVRSWVDLKDRLDSDRRCYAYLHPAMPDEPLIFVEVALVREMSQSIGPLLDPKATRGDPAHANTAVFYSISNCQRGLAGISLGNALIKRVVESIATELPGVKTFATLSPVPSFRAWLDRADSESPLAQALEAIAKRGLQRDPAQSASARPSVVRACARYLLEEKASDGGAFDPVARFHLSNGARMERLNWLADTSPKALRESAGVMVNYLYRPSEIDANHDAYVSDGKIPASKAVRDLARG